MKTVLVILLLSSCAWGRGSRPPRDIKVYSIQSTNDFCNPQESWCLNKVGLVRKQAKEVLPFNKADDFIAVSPSDFERILQTCPTP